ncbi:MAG TPA: hypothetical protein VMM78_05780 [Thermomicrobiales bacterium]|nr:hypothetical protein [Thermomicrobiales bacterium]
MIDTLGLGYAVLIAKPLVMLPLLLAELLVLFSPRVMLTPLTGPIERVALGRTGAWLDVRGLASWMSGYDVTELAALQAPMIRMPAFIPSLSSERLASFGWHASYSSAPVALVSVVALLALVTGLLMSVVYRMLLAAEGLGVGTFRDLASPRLVTAMALRLAGWAAAIVGLMALVSMPVLVVTTFGLIFGFGGSRILWVFVLVPFAWGFVHFYFSIHAMFVDRSGPFDALRSSYLVVRSNFWQSVQFIATTMLITTGMTFALQQMASSAGGVMAAIAINTFVATGIVLAAMHFYRDRARQLGLSVDDLGR